MARNPSATDSPYNKRERQIVDIKSTRTKDVRYHVPDHGSLRLGEKRQLDLEHGFILIYHTGQPHRLDPRNEMDSSQNPLVRKRSRRVVIDIHWNRGVREVDLGKLRDN